MTDIPVYNTNGEIEYCICIDDDIVFNSTRVQKGKKYWYKGIGTKYQQHMILNPNAIYNIIKKSEVFYLGYHVEKSLFKGKSGIFQEKYQPQFTDFIGSCGVKELSIIEHSSEFEFSSVNVIKCVNYDKINNQYYFVLNYIDGREKYLYNPSPSKLISLLEYMVKNDWNFIWDKNSIDDININGLVTDVADIFKSDQLSAKLGTVYSILYSLGNKDFNEYMNLIKSVGLTHSDNISYVFNSVELLNMFQINISKLYFGLSPLETYKRIVLEYLIPGRNCGHCSYIGLGDQIKEQYLSLARREFNINTY